MLPNDVKVTHSEKIIQEQQINYFANPDQQAFEKQYMDLFQNAYNFPQA